MSAWLQAFQGAFCVSVWLLCDMGACTDEGTYFSLTQVTIGRKGELGIKGKACGIVC